MYLNSRSINHPNLQIMADPDFIDDYENYSDGYESEIDSDNDIKVKDLDTDVKDHGGGVVDEKIKEVVIQTQTSSDPKQSPGT
jgi:hypothetical protein